MHAPFPDRRLLDSYLHAQRRITQLFSRLIAHVEANQFETVPDLAEQVDREAGQWVEFEECILYPELALLHSPNTVNRLYREHQTGRDAVKQLLEIETEASLDWESRQQILSMLQVALHHTVASGIVQSFLKALNPTQLVSLYGEYLRISRAKHRWSQLPRRSSFVAPQSRLAYSR